MWRSSVSRFVRNSQNIASDVSVHGYYHSEYCQSQRSTCVIYRDTTATLPFLPQPPGDHQGVTPTTNEALTLLPLLDVVFLFPVLQVLHLVQVQAVPQCLQLHFPPVHSHQRATSDLPRWWFPGPSAWLDSSLGGLGWRVGGSGLIWCNLQCFLHQPRPRRWELLFGRGPTGPTAL